MTETSSPRAHEFDARYFDARDVDARDIDAVLRLLQRNGDRVAPHVASRLHAALCGDQAAIAQVAALLSPAQRAGLSALPDPLPAVRAVRDAVGDTVAALDERDRRLLLTAAVSVDGRVDVALAAAETTLADALASPTPPLLTFAAGRLSFLDPRVRAYLHSAASLGERTDVHARLGAAYRAAGDDGLATWHTSLSTLEGDAALTPALLSLAAHALQSGAAEWAHAVAREAASHAPGDTRLRAHVLAGRAAVAAGLVEDATAWLHAPVAAGGEVAAAALPAYVWAVALRDGSVPDADIARLIAPLMSDDAPRTAPDPGLLEAVCAAAQLHAERGHVADAAAMLSVAERLASYADPAATADALGEEPAPLAEARRWCLVFGVPPEAVDAPAAERAEGSWTASHLSRIATALQHARADRADAALGMLHGTVGTTLGTVGPTPTTLDQPRTAPLLEAHRRVAIALVLFWEGQLARARAELADAAATVPVGLVFGGLAVALARRLDAVTDGVPLETTIALDAAHPTPQSRPLRAGLLVDRAIVAYLDGRMTEAGTLLALAADEAIAPADAGLPLPGLDEPSVWSNPEGSRCPHTPGRDAASIASPPRWPRRRSPSAGSSAS